MKPKLHSLKIRAFPFCAGFTLVQVLLATVLTAILVGVALPSYSSLVSRTQIRSAASSLTTAMETARTAAISQGVTVTVCRSADGSVCGGQWHEGLLVFSDANRNRLVDDSDSILWRGEPVDGFTVRWSAFGNRQYLQFSPQGLALYQNGNFRFCPTSREAGLQAGFILIVNATGRIREGLDSDGNGIVEDSQGRDLECQP